MRAAKARPWIAAIAVLASAPAASALAQSVQLEQIACVERISHAGVDRTPRKDPARLDVRKAGAPHTGMEMAKAQTVRLAGLK
jgi:hypothetical protein